MKTVERRLDRLEDRLAPQGRKHLVIVLTDASQNLALDSSRCVQILREVGHLDTTTLSCVVDLGNIPEALTQPSWSRTCASTAPGDPARDRRRYFEILSRRQPLTH